MSHIPREKLLFVHKVTRNHDNQLLHMCWGGASQYKTKLCHDALIQRNESLVVIGRKIQLPSLSSHDAKGANSIYSRIRNDVLR